MSRVFSIFHCMFRANPHQRSATSQEILASTCLLCPRIHQDHKRIQVENQHFFHGLFQFHDFKSIRLKLGYDTART